MPRRAARIDANQPDVVRVLRGVGASVQVLSQVGQGCPDLLAGVAGLTLVGRFNPQVIRWLLKREDVTIHDGANLLIEVKNPNVPKADQQLTPDEQEWHREWSGQVCIARTIDEALRIAGVPNG